MNRLSRLFAVGIAFAASGCSLAVEPIPSPSPPPPAVIRESGRLTVTWSVDGSTSPDTCQRYGATTLELVVDDSWGRRAATANPPCEAFNVTLDLPAGRYVAEATLVDAASRAVSITKPLRAIDVTAGTNLTIDLDFSRDSILPGRRSD